MYAIYNLNIHVIHIEFWLKACSYEKWNWETNEFDEVKTISLSVGSFLQSSSTRRYESSQGRKWMRLSVIFLQRNQGSPHFCSEFASYCNVNNWNSTNEKCYSNSKEVLIYKTSKRSNWSCMKIIQRSWTYVIRKCSRIAYFYVHSCNHHSTFPSSRLPPRSAVFFIKKFTERVYIKIAVPSIKFHQDFNKQQQQQQKSERKVERTFSISITTKKAFARKKWCLVHDDDELSADVRELIKMGRKVSSITPESANAEFLGVQLELRLTNTQSDDCDSSRTVPENSNLDENIHFATDELRLGKSEKKMKSATIKNRVSREIINLLLDSNFFLCFVLFYFSFSVPKWSSAAVIDSKLEPASLFIALLIFRRFSIVPCMDERAIKNRKKSFPHLLFRRSKLSFHGAWKMKLNYQINDFSALV